MLYATKVPVCFKNSEKFFEYLYVEFLCRATGKMPKLFDFIYLTD